jgi:hypothetical protein
MTAPTPKPPLKWRNVLPVHPAAELLPLMERNELQALAHDIKLNGLRTEITIWSPPYNKGGMPDPHSGALLDGRNRLDALELAGMLSIDEHDHLCIPGPGGEAREVRYHHLSDGEPHAHAISLNIHRRHLTPVQKRELIAALVKATPTASNLQVGKLAQTSDKTVATVRRELEARSEIPNVETRTDTKGRAQPAKKKGRGGRKLAAKKASRSVDEPTAKKQPADTTASQQQKPVLAVSRAVEPLPDNMISHAWMHANASQRTEFVKAHWTDIMWVRDRLGGTALAAPMSPASNVDALPPDILAMPKTEAQRSQS